MILRFIIFSFFLLPVGSHAANYYYNDSQVAHDAAEISAVVTDVSQSGCWGYYATNKGNYYLYPISFDSACIAEYESHGVFQDYKFLKGLAGIVCGLLFIGAVLHNM